MLLKRTLPALSALCLLFVTVSCGGFPRHIETRTLAEAEYLQKEAAAKRLSGDEITVADGFLARARMNNSAKESTDLADLAVAYYRVALARNSADESAQALSQAEAALAQSREQVARYQELLSRVNSGGR